MHSTPVPDAVSLVAAALRGAAAPCWPPAAPSSLVDRVARTAQIHGVSALLHPRAVDAGWPSELTRALHTHALLETMWEMSHQRALATLLASLHEAGVAPLLLKGTALAYSLYPNPALRSRSDTDMLVAAADREKAHERLTALGWQPLAQVSGAVVSYQAGYVLRTGEGAEHEIDLHWKINNSELLSRLFSRDELLEAAIPLPPLGPHARGTMPVHSMLVACMHRGAHKQSPYYVDGVPHCEADRLIWLYDIHLLSQVFTPAHWDLFTQLAARKGLAAVALEAMQQTQSRLGSDFPRDVMDTLARARGELPARYLDAGKLERRWINFVALRSPLRQGRLIAELLFPPRQYMLAKYAQARWRWLPWLYLRRATTGVRKALRRESVA
ncbi:nucleotidyltransferase family protein [Caenimonas aquaedulcis]|uniref:Nucleotidyltransferase family protein n=1 Tax=Caenimonas aquaedulcis TaxID=2793270 RepID=A0A931MHH8_9BURK|nr:nucleotidyltransferase family protein [Caenimonas aquaedulcis]